MYFVFAWFLGDSVDKRELQLLRFASSSTPTSSLHDEALSFSAAAKNSSSVNLATSGNT